MIGSLGAVNHVLGKHIWHATIGHEASEAWMVIGLNDGTMINAGWPSVLEPRFVAKSRHVNIAKIRVVQMSMREPCSVEIRIRENSSTEACSRQIRSHERCPFHRTAG